MFIEDAKKMFIEDANSYVFLSASKMKGGGKQEKIKYGQAF